MRQISKLRMAAGAVLFSLLVLEIFQFHTASVPAAMDYEKQLASAGFPDSYIPSLVALHEKYPQWTFEAVQTGLDWDTVIAQESRNGWNLVPKSGDDARKSTASGAYDWYENTWTIYDGSSWVAANPDYIAYCMDPRNFLNDTDIFQFESLSYSSAQNRAGVESIISDTFMATDVKDSDGTTLSYADAFMEIGKATGVSPYHLASRVRQEQGTAGTSALISGTYSDEYWGYYNYFNVGASGTSQALVIQNGLAYAKSAGWDTRYKSLQGGAEILAENYIAKGQDTLYFEKFNVVYTASLYSHQYMTNVTAAITEGQKMADGYSDKSQAFVFRIPVYENMPDSAVAFTATGNPNNYLKTLEVSGQSLTPTFDGATTDYSLIVDNSVSSVTVSATAVASTSTVTGTGTVSLSVGTNTVKVKCKSGSGSTRTYKITIVRQEASEDAESAGLSSSKYSIGSKYVTGITPGATVSTLLKNVTATSGSAKLLDSSGKEKGSKDAVCTGDKLVCYDSSGTKQSTVRIVIYGDVNGDGDINVLDMIKVNRDALGLESLSGCYLEAGDANRAGDGVNVLDMIYINRHALGLTTIKQS
ncbi:MAG: cadherin-like beta sandwich domain-containing protein [Clostridiales bacterium]|nr:cadherin-like beta sandwich domain-containing protein [Clostridiales bacterium]